jgi:shikimate kinase
LLKEKEHRPLIKNITDDELVSFLSAKRKERMEFYNQAAFTLSGDEITEAGFKKILKEHA